VTWTLRVRADAGGTAQVFVRKHRFEVSAPAGFDEEAPQVSALEYVVGALAADLATGLVALARRRAVAIDQVEAVVRAELDDPLASLGVVGATGHPGLESVRVKLYVASPAERAVLEELWGEAQATSPLLRTLAAACTIDLALEIVP
jgi:hypothetical protein